MMCHFSYESTLSAPTKEENKYLTIDHASFYSNIGQCHSPKAFGLPGPFLVKHVSVVIEGARVVEDLYIHIPYTPWIQKRFHKMWLSESDIQKDGGVLQYSMNLGDWSGKKTS